MGSVWAEAMRATLPVSVRWDRSGLKRCAPRGWPDRRRLAPKVPPPPRARADRAAGYAQTAPPPARCAWIRAPAPTGSGTELRVPVGCRAIPLQLQPDLGRNCAYQLDVARQAHVAAIDAESVLAGLDITHVEDDRILPAGFGQAAKLLGWSAHLQKHRLYHIRVDFHVRSQVLVFHVHRNEGRQLRFAGDRNPKQHGRRQRQKLPTDVLCEEVLHFGSALSGRWFSMGMSAANSSIRCGALRRTPKCVQIRSSTSRRLRPVASSPKAATEMRPVSSETTSDRQSVQPAAPQPRIVVV